VLADHAHFFLSFPTTSAVPNYSDELVHHREPQLIDVLTVQCPMSRLSATSSCSVRLQPQAGRSMAADPCTTGPPQAWPNALSRVQRAAVPGHARAGRPPGFLKGDAVVRVAAAAPRAAAASGRRTGSCPLGASAASSGVIIAPDEQQAVLAWATGQPLSALPCRVAYFPDPSTPTPSASLRGLVAVRNVTPGEVLLEVPFDRIYASKVSRLHTGRKDLGEGGGVTSRQFSSLKGTGCCRWLAALANQLRGLQGCKLIPTHGILSSPRNSLLASC
jgi:hypothetical protein